MLPILRSLVAISLLLVFGDVSTSADLDRSQLELFEKKIRPVLVEHCYKCHSTEAAEVQGKLRLDSRENILKGGESGKLLISGNSKESLLLKAIRYEGPEMPPAGKLPESVIKDFEHWIETGAPDPREGASVPTAARSIDIEAGRKLWAYLPLADASPPEIEAAAKYPQPIDPTIIQCLHDCTSVISFPHTTSWVLRSKTWFLVL